MRNWDEELQAIEEFVNSWPKTSLEKIATKYSSPWHVLVATIISLRTKDAVTLKASESLFSLAPNLSSLLKLKEEDIANAIYPAGFYRRKATNLRKIASILTEKYRGELPSEKRILMTLPGVGLKTANLVLGMGFNIPAICVDIHVHRIANRRGWVQSSNPNTSEKELSVLLPQRWWIPVNSILVNFGQNICTPISPKCSLCPVNKSCPQIGVVKMR